MASVYQLKSRFQGLLRPLVGRLAAIGVTANQVTVSATVLSLAWGTCEIMYYPQRWPWLLLPAVLFLRMALNAVDGMLAREHNMKSRLGAVLNELGDVISDSALYLPFALPLANWAWLSILVALLAVISEMTGVIGLQIGASRRYDGPMGKSDRAAAFGTFGFVLGLGVAPYRWLPGAVGLVVALLVVTIVNRTRQALKEGSGNV
jgi:CDP-diacylglycerol--glycerol-3-phosphate 3-phosphatidyltransferase